MCRSEHPESGDAHAFYCPSCARLARPAAGATMLTNRHAEILDAIGPGGASPAELGRHLRAREFADLDVAGLIVYSPESHRQPFRVLSNDGRRGTWNLTAAGADAIGALSPLRTI